MSAIAYHDAITKVLDDIRRTQIGKIQQAGEAIAGSIASGGLAWLFGSGHSVIPVMDVFPRYGSFVGFVPLYDPRLMWSNVVGPGGARELLWIERQEGYAPVFLQSYALRRGDCFIVFSHGGLNAAPIEAALYAKERGLTVITVSSLANAAVAKATHSSGQEAVRRRRHRDRQLRRARGLPGGRRAARRRSPRARRWPSSTWR